MRNACTNKTKSLRSYKSQYLNSNVSMAQLVLESDIKKSEINYVTQPLVESLSRRELGILDLIAQGLSNRSISERLTIALSTVKGHIQNIFGKLQVQRRTEAVARARVLRLIQ